MPNPVVSFEIRGGDTAALHTFYRDAFGWQIEAFPGGGYAFIETTEHTHDDDATQFTGADAHMNDGVVLGSAWGQPAWKFQGEEHWRSFEPGVSGGIAQGPAAVTVYIRVPDLDATLKRVVACGGAIVREPTEVAPNIITAAFRDPAGNEMCLIR